MSLVRYACDLCHLRLRNLHPHRLITPIIIIQKINSSCGGLPIRSLHKAISVHFSNSQRAWLPSTTWMSPSHQSPTLGQKLMCVVAARRVNLNSSSFPETSWAAQIHLMNFQATKFLFVQVFWKNPWKTPEIKSQKITRLLIVRASEVKKLPDF